MEEKTPALQWYVKQYLGDDAVLAMDWDARGMHVHLLNIGWQQKPVGSIPDDIGTIRRWLGLPSGFADADRVWARVWPQIRAAWALKDGRWFNAGLVRAWERQQTYKQNGSKRRAKSELNQEDEDSDAEELPYLALAQKVCAELCLSGPSWINAIAGAVEFLVKFENKTKNQAVEFLIARAKGEIQRGTAPSTFWFTERKWKTAEAKGQRGFVPR